ncbi:MAG TPA: cyclic nucleotide-binding domain-containing protein [Thermohalobaculum sp.]|nr:cyclic nucleotide-binding domain-containing protein [Thermohalobaculum sp.]
MVDLSLASGLGPLQAVALAGVICFLGAHAALQAGWMRGRSPAFSGLNLAAAGLMAPALVAAFGWIAAVALALWAAIALAGVLRLGAGRGRMGIGADEAPVVEALVPGLPSDRARVLLGLGQWREVRPGTPLATEGEPVRWLSYIAEGYCEVERAEERIATLGAGSLVGEVTLFSGGPATATVRTIGRTRIFSLEEKHLRRLLASEDDIRAALEHNILSIVGGRLVRTTDDVARLKRVFEKTGLGKRKGGRRR